MRVSCQCFASKTMGMGGVKMLEMGRKCLDSRNFAWVCVDIEWWERNPRKITEIGISILTSDPFRQTFVPAMQSFHLLPDPAYKKLNGRYVPNHRDYFAFGTSRVMPLKECRKFMEAVFNLFAQSQRQLFLVGHNLHNDIRQLQNIGIDVNALPPVLDTMEIGLHLWGRPIALGDICRHMHVDAGLLHNAGNDAHATILLLAQLCDRNFNIPEGSPEKVSNDKVERKLSQKAGYRRRESAESLVNTLQC